ncbi:MAG: LytR family transcriptional regulator [Ruminococcus sp.]|nr:LytR family transcriptional regulator [Ruminococcus sp.]
MNNENNAAQNEEMKEKIERIRKRNAQKAAGLNENETEAARAAADEYVPEEDAYDEASFDEAAEPREKKRFSIKNPDFIKNTLVKTGAIVLSLMLMVLMIFNLPIIAYNKEGKPIEHISIMTFIKRWQPLVNVEGELEPNSMSNLNINSEIVNDGFTDGLDLDQIIEGQFSVLVLGFDESSGNSDVNWVFQFDIAAAKLNVLQIPRDSCLPYYTTSYTGKFNSIYSMGDSTKTPIQRVVNAVQDNFGIPIDAYITTNCYDIVDMVDLIGGIPISLDERIVYEPDKIIPAGDTVLNGQQAEWFVRYRHGFSEGDIGRVKNQRKFLAAAMQRLLNIIEEDGKMTFYGYLKEIYENQYILTNLSLESITKLADLAATISLDNVQVNMVPGEGAWYYPQGHDKQSIWSIHKQATIDMLNKYYRPYQHDMTLPESAIIEIVTDYVTNSYDNTSDTLQELQDGAVPGQSKTEAPADAET